MAFPMYQASLLLILSTMEVGVQVAKTKRSATDKFSKNKLVELLKTLEVKMTIITSKLPKIPTAKMMVQRTRLVQAMYSGTVVGSTSSSLVMLASMEVFIFANSQTNWEDLSQKIWIIVRPFAGGGGGSAASKRRSSRLESYYIRRPPEAPFAPTQSLIKAARETSDKREKIGRMSRHYTNASK